MEGGRDGGKEGGEGGRKGGLGWGRVEEGESCEPPITWFWAGCRSETCDRNLA